MVRLLKFIGYVLFFVVSLMYFTPKVSLYYFLENKIEPFGVIVTGEEVVDNGLTLSLQDATITLKSIESAVVKNVDVAIFGVYNSVDISDVTLASTASTFLPTDVKNIKITYSILNPLNIKAFATGGFGEAEAKVNIVDRDVVVNLKPSKLMTSQYRSTMRNFKKLKDGGYEYAKTF
jgi:hypothetical protein